MIRKPQPKTAAGHRALKRRMPVPEEGAKTAVFLKGTATSSLVHDALKELYALKKPDAVMFSKRNDVHPFDDFKPLEFFSLKNDASFFVLASHSKKKPHNITIARMFDHQMLDMIELGITDISFMDEFQGPKAALGNRPLMIFHGEAWTSEPLEQAKSMFLDMFSGDTYSDKLDLRGVSHVICLTAPTKDKILMRTYHILLKSSGVKLPRVELVDMGPHFDFAVKRHLPANASMMKEAMRIPKELQPKKMKNISRNDFGEKTGRIWMDPQDLNKLQTRKMKGLKRKSDTTTEVVEDEDDI